MSVATVITFGFGSFGSVNRLPTLGYGGVLVPEPEPETSGIAGGSGSGGPEIRSRRRRRFARVVPNPVHVYIEALPPRVGGGSTITPMSAALGLRSPSPLVRTGSTIRPALARVQYSLPSPRVDAWAEDTEEELALLGLSERDLIGA